MAQIPRPPKQGGNTTYTAKVAAGYRTILAGEVDADLDTIYGAWNSGADTTNLRDGAVTSEKLAADAVGPRELADGGVFTAALADGAVTTPKLADGAVTDPKIVTVAWPKVTGVPPFVPAGSAGGDLSGSYPSPAIRDGAVSTAKLAPGAVGSGALAAGSVGSTQLAAGAVTLDKLATLASLASGTARVTQGSGDTSGNLAVPLSATQLQHVNYVPTRGYCYAFGYVNFRYPGLTAPTAGGTLTVTLDLYGFHSGVLMGQTQHFIYYNAIVESYTLFVLGQAVVAVDGQDQFFQLRLQAAGTAGSLHVQWSGMAMIEPA